MQRTPRPERGRSHRRDFFSNWKRDRKDLRTVKYKSEQEMRGVGEFFRSATLCVYSVLSECFCWIDPRRPIGGQPTGDSAYGCEQHRRSYESGPVARLEA